MELRIATQSGLSSFEGETVGVEAGPALVAVLATKQYTEPLLASLRELVTNACDAHVAAGNVEDPFDVYIDIDRETGLVTVRVRDYGSGMEFDFLRREFFKLGRSTKREDRNAAGAFGIGAKAAFSVSPLISVTSYTGELSMRAVGTLDPTRGIVVQCDSPRECDEPRGTEVFFTYAPEDLVKEWRCSGQRLTGEGKLDGAVLRSLYPVGHLGSRYRAKPRLWSNGEATGFLSLTKLTRGARTAYVVGEMGYVETETWVRYAHKLATNCPFPLGMSLSASKAVPPDTSVVVWHNAAFTIPKDILLASSPEYARAYRQRHSAKLASDWYDRMVFVDAPLCLFLPPEADLDVTPDRMQVVDSPLTRRSIGAAVATIAKELDLLPASWRRDLDTNLKLSDAYRRDGGAVSYRSAETVYRFMEKGVTGWRNWPIRQAVMEFLSADWPEGLERSLGADQTRPRTGDEVKEAELERSDYTLSRWCNEYFEHKTGIESRVYEVDSSPAKITTGIWIDVVICPWEWRPRLFKFAAAKGTSLSCVGSRLCLVEVPSESELSAKLAELTEKLAGTYFRVRRADEIVLADHLRPVKRKAKQRPDYLQVRYSGKVSDGYPVTLDTLRSKAADGKRAGYSDFQGVWVPVKGHEVSLKRDVSVDPPRFFDWLRRTYHVPTLLVRPGAKTEPLEELGWREFEPWIVADFAERAAGSLRNLWYGEWSGLIAAARELEKRLLALLKRAEGYPVAQGLGPWFNRYHPGIDFESLRYRRLLATGLDKRHRHQPANFENEGYYRDLDRTWHAKTDGHYEELFIGEPWKEFTRRITRIRDHFHLRRSAAANCLVYGPDSEVMRQKMLVGPANRLLDRLEFYYDQGGKWDSRELSIYKRALADLMRT